jgi:hypothetical protein
MSNVILKWSEGVNEPMHRVVQVEEPSRHVLLHEQKRAVGSTEWRVKDVWHAPNGIEVTGE